MPARSLARTAAVIALSAWLPAWPGSEQAAAAGVTRSIEVFKPDGSVQCEPGSGVPLEQMRRQLTGAGIAVHAARTARDMQIRPAVCGTATGTLNAYIIDAGRIEEARALGFEPMAR
jgi:hypothetical protein